MARLHHVTRELLARAGRAPDPGPVQALRPSRPHDRGGVEPWFQLTPDAPSADTRVGVGSGVVATLETFGGITGPTVGDGDDAGERLPVVLGGAIVPPGTPPPESPGAFRRQCGVAVGLWAAELGVGRQCLLVFGVRALGRPAHAMVQSFAGIVPIAEDPIHGEGRVAFVLDATDDGRLAVDLVLRVCGNDPRVQLGLRGAVGYLL